MTQVVKVQINYSCTPAYQRKAIRHRRRVLNLEHLTMLLAYLGSCPGANGKFGSISGLPSNQISHELPQA